MRRWIIGALLLAVSGCETPPGGPADSGALPNWADASEAYNRRIERLANLASGGVIEMRWQDESGKHFEQGDIRLWVMQPRRTALRIDKFGDVLLWIGSDLSSYWLFNMLDDPSELTLGHHGDPVRASGLVVQPLALLDLMALTPLPVEGEVGFGEERGTWTLTADGAHGPMRVTIDGLSGLPTKVELLGASGEAIAHSVLKRYESVVAEGMDAVMRPSIATSVVIEAAADAEQEAGVSGSISLFLDGPTTNMDDQPIDRVFDLSKLRQSLRPERVQEVAVHDGRGG